jgi:hypothetical protein
MSCLKNILINLQNQEAIAPLFGPKPNVTKKEATFPYAD